jgi:hypothetical protein
VRKWTVFLIFAVTVVFNAVMTCNALDENSFAVGPSQLIVTVPANGSNSTYVYITSYVDGELIVGTENLPFHIEPTTIPITSTDRTRKVELTVHGNTSLVTGQYSGKLTLLFYTGNNVAHGVKINTNITQEGSGSEPSWFDKIIDIITHNWVIIVVVAMIVVALILGIFIGRKSRKSV